AVQLLRNFYSPAQLSLIEINNRCARIVFIRDKSEFSVFADRELLRVRPYMPAIDQLARRWIDYAETISAFVRGRAIFIQAGRHTRRAAQRNKDSPAIGRSVNAARPFPH